MPKWRNLEDSADLESVALCVKVQVLSWVLYGSVVQLEDTSG